MAARLAPNSALWRRPRRELGIAGGERGEAEPLPAHAAKTSCPRRAPAPPLQLAAAPGLAGHGAGGDGGAQGGGRGESERRAGPNIFPACSRGQTSPPRPLLLPRGETSSPEFPFPAPLEGRLRLRGAGGSPWDGRAENSRPQNAGLGAGGSGWETRGWRAARRQLGAPGCVPAAPARPRGAPVWP